MLHNLSSMRNSLNAQQTRMDVIANNIANINTTGYKRNRVSFGDAIYHAMYGPAMPVTQQVRCGSGVMVSGTEKDFKVGPVVSTGRTMDFAVDGDGFFGVVLEDGSMAYTRDGCFTLDGYGNLVNSKGYRIYTDMILPQGAAGISVSETGEITTVSEDGTSTVIGTIPLFMITNPLGLEAMGNGLFRETGASGAVIPGTAGSDGLGSIRQGCLEGSNVDLAEEMVDLIVNQRAYQFSAQTIRTLDEMWGLANGLQR